MSDADLGVRFGEAAAPSYVGNLTNYFTNMGTAFGGATQAMQSQFGSYTANIGSFTTRRKPVSSPTRSDSALAAHSRNLEKERMPVMPFRSSRNPL